MSMGVGWGNVVKIMNKLMCTNHDEVHKSEVDPPPWFLIIKIHRTGKKANEINMNYVILYLKNVFPSMN